MYNFNFEQQYIQVCLKFSKQTRVWKELNSDYHYYLFNNDWREDSDHAYSGPSVAWAFHRNRAYIIDNANVYLLRELAQYLEIAKDDEWTNEQIFEGWISDFFKGCEI